MAKLTAEADWNYECYTPPPLTHFDSVSQQADTWIGVARTHLPSAGEFIELGCAPGYCSAAVTYKMADLRLTGVDFSPSAGSYLTTMQAIGRPEARLIKANLFQFQSEQQYDVVASFGLIEHFSDEDLGKILEIHDRLLKPGGKLIIEVPNFNGWSGLWHKIFDRPSYHLHNIGTMSPETFQFFQRRGYQQQCCDYIGALEVWGDTGAYAGPPWLTKLTRSLEKKINKHSARRTKNGRPLQGKNYSPALIYIAQKPRA